MPVLQTKKLNTGKCVPCRGHTAGDPVLSPYACTLPSHDPTGKEQTLVLPVLQMRKLTLRCFCPYFPLSSQGVLPTQCRLSPRASSGERQDPKASPGQLVTFPALGEVGLFLPDDPDDRSEPHHPANPIPLTGRRGGKQVWRTERADSRAAEEENGPARRNQEPWRAGARVCWGGGHPSSLTSLSWPQGPLPLTHAVRGLSGGGGTCWAALRNGRGVGGEDATGMPLPCSLCPLPGASHLQLLESVLRSLLLLTLGL